MVSNLEIHGCVVQAYFGDLGHSHTGGVVGGSRTPFNQHDFCSLQHVQHVAATSVA